MRLHRRQRSLAIGHAGHLSHLSKTKQVGDNRLTATVLVRTIPMEPIATASGLDVHKRQRQIIAAGEPGKSACRISAPFDCAVGAPGCEARRDCRRRFERLLIKGRRRHAMRPERVGADGPEEPGGRRLHAHQPPKRAQPGLDLVEVAGRHPSDDQRLREPCIVIRKACLEPHPIWRLDGSQ